MRTATLTREDIPPGSLCGPFLRCSSKSVELPGVFFEKEYLAWIERGARTWRPLTVKSFRSKLQQGARILGHKPLADISEADIDALQSAVMVREGRANGESWIRASRTVFKMFFDWCVERGFMAANPITKRSWPLSKRKDGEDLRVHEERIADFSKEQIGAWASKLPPAYRKFLYAACYLGWRKHQLCSLRWWMVDKVWWINCPADIVKQRIRMHTYVPKALQEVLAPRGEPSAQVIAGLPKDESFINSVLKAGAEKAGLDPATAIPHNCRRTWCRWMVEAGASREEVMQIQGWKSDNVLLSHYWPKVKTERQISLAERL
jgi:integrase